MLVTGRVLQHYNAGTMTRRTSNIELVDRDWLEIHPDDAARLWISDGDKVSVASRVGRTELYTLITERIEPGHVFTSFHFPEARTNLLVGQSADVNTSCPEYKVVAVDVQGPLARNPGKRQFYTTSSCGICGKGALEEIAVHAPIAQAGPQVDRDKLASLPDRLRQPSFARTGGVHATGLFDPTGELLIVREDVGRHNAMDKVIGRALLDGLLPLTSRILCVSGRLSFELVQKAAVSQTPILVGVGAPSSLAIQLAADRGMTLGGFARHGTVNIYTGAERIRS